MLWLALWSAACAALGYAALAVWRLSLLRRSPGSAALAVAFAGMAIWSALLLLTNFPLPNVGKMIRDLAWFAYLLATTRGFDQEPQTRRKIAGSLLVLSALAIARIILAAAIMSSSTRNAVHTLLLSSLIIGWLLAIGGVFFVHLLYRALTSSSGSGFRLILIVLGIMWAYDINLITVTLLGFSQANYLMATQGIFALLLMPAFALAARRKERWKVTLSRQAATSSVMLMAIGTYFVAISATSRALIWAANNDEIAKIILAIALSLGCAVIAFFPRIGRWLKKILVEHLFEHRYDYRAEWLRFSATIGDRSRADMSPEERVIRSVADVTESSSGLLLLVNRYELHIAGTWNWQYAVPVGQDLTVAPAWLRFLEKTGRIVTLDEIRNGELGLGDELVPGWLLDAEKAWAGVPLVRAESLIGLIVLGRPAFDRALDWEDFDLLKVIGQQVAMHLADAQSQAELEQARQFDEFNRRFAFIIHDLKNLVSQLSLVSSNAAEHGANPKFQQAMAKTLTGATAKMKVLLARLSADGPTTPNLARVDLGQLLTEIADNRQHQHPFALHIQAHCQAWADPEQLRQAIDHLIQNAIEAGPPQSPINRFPIDQSPIVLSLAQKSETALITIKDNGVGMSPEFIRKELFKPFASSKQGGFGIGAAEAKALIEAMGGKLDVMSVEGAGTQFSILLPLLAPSLEPRAGAGEA